MPVIHVTYQRGSSTRNTGVVELYIPVDGAFSALGVLEKLLEGDEPFSCTVETEILPFDTKED